MTTWKRDMVKTERGEFELFTKGDGPPVCITHHYSEFNETGDYFADAFTETHQVFLVNLREAGRSPKADQPYQLSMLETVFDLEAVREALGYAMWGFAGHSTGGMLGVIYGIHFSASLAFNVIVSAAAREYMTFSKDCIYHSGHPKFQRMQDLIEALKRQDLSSDEREALKKERTKLSLYAPEKYEEIFSRNIDKKMSAARMNFFSRELHIYDVTRKLCLIQTPTLILCGRHDVQCPLNYSEEMQEGIQGSELVIFEESNHYPFLEEAEKFTEAIQRFFEKIY
ncbi:alpha/beta hydrolase [Halobacillus fulvus]|nr:alpha/beta hydrolase [Halobacillus fulvus]